MRNNEVLISVIVPIYNCELYVERCLKSILDLNDLRIEVIVIDDGSTDSSLEIIEKFISNYSNLIVIRQKNLGVSEARNKGLDIAKGKFITFMDSDDYLEENYIETIIKIENRYYPDLLNFGFISEVQDKFGNVISSDIINFKEKLYPSKEKLKEDLIELWDKHMLYNIWNKIYLNDIIQKHNIRFSKNFGEDMRFNIEYLSHSNIFYNSDKCFYHYINERNGSITANYNENLLKIRIEEYYYFNNYFKDNGYQLEEYIEFSSRRFIERAVGYMENVCSSNDLSRKCKLKIIKDTMNNDVVRETLKYAKPKSKKMRIILIPIKYQRVLNTYILVRFIGFVRKKRPSLFNKLKNKR